jgi:hypothetical protein
MHKQRNIDNEQGELPNLCFDGKNTSKHLSDRINLRVLQGAYPPENRREEDMIRDFRASGLTIEKFLAL